MIVEETLNLRNEIIETLKRKKEYFLVFKNIAKFKGKFTQQIAQFKTEKWVQAELAFSLFKNYEVIPEYYSRKWDLKLILRNTKSSFLLHLKCYSASAQQAKRDFVSIQSDRDEMLIDFENESQKLFCIILSKDNSNKKLSYTNQMTDKITCGFEKEKFNLIKEEILFADSDEGIIIFWIEKNTN